MRFKDIPVSTPTKRQLCEELKLDWREYSIMPYLSFRRNKVIIADISEKSELFKKVAEDAGLQFSQEGVGKAEVFRQETDEEVVSRLKEDVKVVRKTIEEERFRKFRELTISFGINQYCLAHP